MIHKLSDVQSKNIGVNTNIWQFCVVLSKANIGDNCNICANCFIENDVIVGNNVTVKCGVQLWNGVTLEDNVFIGPNATVLCGITIGENAMIGAGSVVTKDVPANEVWVGNPARFVRKLLYERGEVKSFHPPFYDYGKMSHKRGG